LVDTVVVHSDGAARGNPGPAAIAYAIYDERGSLLEEGAKCVGRRTNNEAEYEALLWAMERARRHMPRTARFRCDSELVVRQVKGVYKVRKERLKPLHERVLTAARHFERFEIVHVRRDDPGAVHVDALANDALDEAG
jgi:ribonuclease HI